MAKGVDGGMLGAGGRGGGGGRASLGVQRGGKTDVR